MQRWLRKHVLPVALFGGLAATLLAVTAIAAIWGPSGFWRHVVQRNVEMHLLAGTALYVLFGRFQLLAERLYRKRSGKRSWRLPWPAWFFGPVAVILAISLTQEYGLSMLGESAGTWGGDWAYNKASLPERFKSLADTACWMWGALAGAWATYFMADRYDLARDDYLAWKESR